MKKSRMQAYSYWSIHLLNCHANMRNSWKKLLLRIIHCVPSPLHESFTNHNEYYKWSTFSYSKTLARSYLQIDFHFTLIGESANLNVMLTQNISKSIKTRSIQIRFAGGTLGNPYCHHLVLLRIAWTCFLLI